MIFQSRDRANLRAVCEEHRARGERLVFTNGCFDILHAGHIECLLQAARYGDVLIVGINSDASVRRLKGEGRPVQSENDRAFILSQLRFVSHVAIFDEDTPESLIREIRPKVLVKGGDWEGKQIAGSDIVESVKFVPYLPGRSTTKILGGGT